MTTTSATYGGDQYTFGYSDILNRFYFTRASVTPRAGVTYDLQILSNDSLSQYNGAWNFGGAYVLGCNQNTVFNLPTATVVTVFLPNAPSLQPYSYLYVCCRQINNLNYCSDIILRNDIIYRAPLFLNDTGKYMYQFVEEASEEFQRLQISTLNNKLDFDIVDQYNNPLLFPSNAAIDLTIKLVMTDE